MNHLDDFDPVALAEDLVTKTVVRATIRAKTSPGKAKKKVGKPAKPQEPHIMTNNIPGNNTYNRDGSDDLLPGILLGESGLSNDIAKGLPFTNPEIRFLLIYLQGKISIDKAMIAAGYTDIGQRSRYSRATNILKRYTAQTEDARNIFRDVGLSEAQVAINIKELTETAGSEMVRLNANALAAKCLRLNEEPQQTHQGVTINIITHADSDGRAAPDRPGTQVNTQIIQTTKPLQITR
jgi:hypothetical protein